MIAIKRYNVLARVLRRERVGDRLDKKQLEAQRPIKRMQYSHLKRLKLAREVMTEIN